MEPIDCGLTILQVACGASHCVALANNQQAVYSWGCGDGGRLGLGDNVDRLEPTPIAEFHGEVIVQVAAANWHSAAIVLIPPMLHGGLVSFLRLPLDEYVPDRPRSSTHGAVATKDNSGRAREWWLPDPHEWRGWSRRRCLSRALHAVHRIVQY